MAAVLSAFRPRLLLRFGWPAVLLVVWAGRASLARAQRPPAHPVPPHRPPAGAPTKTPRWAVQVGAYANRTDADDLALKVAALVQQPAVVTTTNVRGKTLYRIRAFANTKREALALAARLRRKGRLPTWVTPVE